MNIIFSLVLVISEVIRYMLLDICERDIQYNASVHYSSKVMTTKVIN